MLWNATSTAWITWTGRHQRKRRNVTKEKRNENQSDQPICGQPGQGPALLYGGAGFYEEGRFQSGPISLADRGLARRTGRHSAAAGAEQQSRGQNVSAGDFSTGSARVHV